MGGNMKKPDDSKIIEAINKSRGNLSQAAKGLGVSRMTLYDWMKKDETLREELIHAREQLCDMAEDVIPYTVMIWSFLKV